MQLTNNEKSGLPRRNVTATRTCSIWGQKSYVRGQSLFELIMAIGISAVIIIVIVSLVNNSVQNATFSKNQTLAARFAEAATEWLRGQRDNNIAIFMTNSQTPSWCLVDANLSDTSWNRSGTCNSNDVVAGTTFIRQVNFSTSVSGGKTIIMATVFVSWTDSKGTHKVTSATNFSDWRQR